MDNVELKPAENFDVIDKPGSSSGAKVSKITKPMDDPEVPDGSRNEGLRKRHGWVAGSHKIVFIWICFTGKVHSQWSRYSLEIQSNQI